ncbi:CsbD family protein [Kribbella sp. NPDC055110]
MGVGRKAKHAAEKAKGKVKKVTGKATDNRDLEAEGRVEETTADLKQAGEKTKDAFKD